MVTELNAPYEKSVEYEWNTQTQGGARYLMNKKNEENSSWPINPQYLLKFDGSVSMKIILRKTTGHFSNETANVGMLLTKPTFHEDKSQLNKVVKRHKQNATSFNKNDQILRVLESTEKILENKPVDTDKVIRKLAFNKNEWVVESSYNSNYSSCLFMYLNKIDSPLIVIPTLQEPNIKFNFKLYIYSNKPIILDSLNNEVSIA
jgi:hypothetical protein